MDEHRPHNTAAPGWYQDPSHFGRSRYWDGQAWTEHVAAASAQEQQHPVAQPDAAAPDRKPVSLFNAKQRAQELQTEVDQLKAILDRMGLADAPLIEAENTRLRTELTELQRQRAEIVEHIGAARATLIHTQDLQELQAVGYYRYHHPAETSVQLKDELLRVQAAIKESIKNKTAITASTGFTFNGSIAQGSKFVSDMSRIMLRAYNVEAENCVKTVKAGNLAAAAQRLFKAGEQIMKQGQMINLRIADHYHRLRVTELELAADVHMMVQREKELERERREELREQRRAEQELATERAKLDKELSHYRNALRALEVSGDAEGANQLRAKLNEVQRALDNVDYRAANIRAGFVYVISNMGAFGINVVKIGMTRRLDPMDRVRELGDASVPFKFDVHALFFADDAVTVETKLHQAFSEQRVNKVNNRREFFYANPTEVLEVLTREIGHVMQFTEEPTAEEYLISIGKSDTTF